MGFGDKLKKLRKEKDLTQEELAQKLYVSRTAVSKWETGRGYPGIDSVKAIAKFFSVTVDELLSGDDVLSFAEAQAKKTQKSCRELVFALLDISAAILMFLPIFRQSAGAHVSTVTLFSMTETAIYIKLAYIVAVLIMSLWGVFFFAAQLLQKQNLVRYGELLSLILNAMCVFLFIVSPQPYAGALALSFLIVKVFLTIKRQ